MKQGKATTSTIGATKQEPISHKVNVGAVSDIGLQQVHTRGNSAPLYEGRGLEAPMVGATVYKKGSQS